ncbi:MAG: methyltransferase domain-containing protein [Parvibaculum sp.]|nr:methyltransferase domain-containing protein [Parvibaculum sp.]
MSDTTLVNLATVGSDELQAMPVAVFTSALESMSGDAIARFRRMRKLSATHRQALEKFLVEHPDKRPGQQDVSDSKGDKKSPPKKARSTETGIVMEGLLRLIAWWEGMDTDDVARAKGVARRKKKKKTKKAKAPVAVQPKTVVQPAVAAAAPEAPEALVLGRIDIIQKLWGEGFSLPGGPEFAVKLVRPLAFEKDGLYLDLAPGLGGAMRAVAKTFGVTVKGLETDAQLAAAGHEMSVQAGVAATAPVLARPDGFSAEDFAPEGQYAAIFMRETLFAVEDRAAMLAHVGRALREGGSLMFTDFVLARDEIDDDMLVVWQNAEAAPVFPWTEAKYRETLESQHYNIDRIDDLTAEYLPLIHAGWRHFHDCLQNAKLPPETAAMLMREGNAWLARSRALETGMLRLLHVHALRRPAGIETGTPTEEERGIDAELVDAAT